MEKKIFKKSLYSILLCISFVTSTEIDANESSDSWFDINGPVIILSAVVIAGHIILSLLEGNNPEHNVDNPVKTVCKTGDEFRNYNSTLSTPENIGLELQLARQDVVQNMSLQECEYEAIDVATQNILMSKKDMLRNVPKSCVMKGSMRSPSVSLSGCLDIANIVALEQAAFSSKGLIENSLSKKLSFMHGDFIIAKSIFYGQTHIEQEASVISYNVCLLDELCIHKKDVIIELRDTIVTGDIIFDHPGIVVIDKKTVLGGTILNARVMMARD